MVDPHEYRLYGLCLRSDWPLPYQEVQDAGSPDIFLQKSDRSLQQMCGLSDKTIAGSQCIELEDGAIFVHWPDLMEFVIACDGRNILGFPLTSDPLHTLQAFFFGGVLSFALLKLGIEQLHAAAIAVDGRAIGFVGDAGAGKSTVASAFVKRGYELLTDDLLVIRVKGEAIVASPGLPRLKLFADSAETLDGAFAEKTVRNTVTGKQILSLSEHQFYQSDAPVQVLYSLNPVPAESSGVSIEPLSQHNAFVEICKATFNSGITKPARLGKQFQIAGRLASSVPVRRLSYHRSFAALPALCDAVIADI